MEKQMTVTTNIGSSRKNYMRISKAIQLKDMALRKIATYYSSVLERRIDLRQTKALLEAQAAFFATIFPADYSLILRAAACVWLVTALRKCRALL